MKFQLMTLADAYQYRREISPQGEIRQRMHAVGGVTSGSITPGDAMFSYIDTRLSFQNVFLRAATRSARARPPPLMEAAVLPPDKGGSRRRPAGSV
jgi:hypothetical protein